MSDTPIVLFSLTTSLYFPKQDSRMSELHTTFSLVSNFAVVASKYFVIPPTIDSPFGLCNFFNSVRHSDICT